MKKLNRNLLDKLDRFLFGGKPAEPTAELRKIQSVYGSYFESFDEVFESEQRRIDSRIKKIAHNSQYVSNIITITVIREQRELYDALMEHYKKLGYDTKYLNISFENNEAKDCDSTLIMVIRLHKK